MLSHAPIAYVCYNRPQIVDITLKALCDAEGAKQSVLHIFVDGVQKTEHIPLVEHVLALCQCDYVAQSFAAVYLHREEANRGGCATLRHVVQTMASLSPNFIIIEDDVLLSPYGLAYFNTALSEYAHVPSVFSVSAWRPPLMKIPGNYPWDAWFCPRAHIWGWASWSDRVKNIDWTGSAAFEMAQYPFLLEAFNQGGDDMAAMLFSTLRAPTIGWDIIMDFHRFKYGQVCLTPLWPYSKNIGAEVSSIGSGSVNLEGQTLERAKAHPFLPSFVVTEPSLMQAHKLGMAALYS